jgi:hypothetical protein
VLNDEKMERIAQKATNKKLQGYDVNDDMWAKIVLGKRVSNNKGVFELFIPGQRPVDAKVISRATVARESGSVNVEVFL